MSKTGITDGRLDDLENERDFLLRSIQDLEDERDAGDVSDEDFSRLYDRYATRAAEVLRAIESIHSASTASLTAQDSRVADGAQEEDDETGELATATDNDAAASSSKNRPRKRRRGLLVGGILCLLAGIIVAVVVANTGVQLPGNTITGGDQAIKLPTGEQVQRLMDQAALLEQEGQLSEALTVYEEVLQKDPSNALALSEAGWIEFEAGILDKSKKTVQQGATYEEGAVALDPELASARAYLGTMLLIEGQPKDAVVQFGQFINDKPGASAIAPFLPDIRLAYTRAQEPLPPIPGVPNKSSTTTTKPTTTTTTAPNS
jgi:tetratricopeptide (TPR) repeat protein